jgi:hypothetical protein
LERLKTARLARFDRKMEHGDDDGCSKNSELNEHPHAVTAQGMK